LVTVPTTVFDRNGLYVINLKKEDFQIFEDGTEQKIALFEPTEQPFTVLLLLDTSGSMSYYLENSVRAVNAFIKQLRPEDRIIIATFNNGGNIKIGLKASKKRDLGQKLLIETSRYSTFAGGSNTTTFDAVEKGINYMKKFRGRRAILLFGDGEQYGIKASAKSNLRTAEEQEALIYTIRFGDNSAGKLFKNARDYMQALAEKTGGRAYQVNESTDLEKTFSMVAEELGRQYYLGYYLEKQPQAGEKRLIKVRMRQPNLVVRARESYIVKPTKTNQK
jgi:VWFA-related protein